MDRAAYWLKEADGDRDEAVECVVRYVTGRLRRKTIIAAIDLLVRIREKGEERGANEQHTL